MLKHMPGTSWLLQALISCYVTMQCCELNECIFLDLTLRSAKSATAKFIVTAKLTETVCFATLQFFTFI